MFFMKIFPYSNPKLSQMMVRMLPHQYPPFQVIERSKERVKTLKLVRDVPEDL